MALVTSETQKRFILFQEIIGNRSMRIVADTAVLGYRSMLKDEGSLKLGVAVVTEIIHGSLNDILFIGCMGIMTTAAFHFTFPDGVMGREVHLGLFFPVAPITEIGLFGLEQFSFLVLMNLAAIDTPHILGSVYAVRPPTRRIAVAVYTEQGTPGRG